MIRPATTLAAVVALPLAAALVSPQAPAGAQPATTYALATCYDVDQTIAERPQRAVYNCDGSAAIEEMTWTSWGPDGATGTGLDDAIECKPSCAEGARLVNPIVVRAWNPRPVQGCPADVAFYSDMTFAYPEGVPPWITPGTTWDDGVEFVTIDGMPGVHWSNRQPFGCPSAN